MIDEFMWLFVALSLLGNYFVIKKNVHGFSIWIVTNIAWVIYDAYKGIYSQSALFLIYTVFALYGVYEWKYKRKAP